MNQSEAGKLGAKAAQATIAAKKQKRIDEYLRNPKLCLYCKSIIDYEKRINDYCNHSCCASYNNVGKDHSDYFWLDSDGIRRQKEKKNKEKLCRSCGKDFKYEKNRNKFCRECIAQNKHTVKCDYTAVDNCKTPATLKNFLIKKYGHKCFICENSEWCGQPIPIQIDHISGNSSDNSESNLRLLCPNCHAQTPTFCGKNKGNGRKHRVDRYYKEKEIYDGYQEEILKNTPGTPR